MLSYLHATSKYDNWNSCITIQVLYRLSHTYYLSREYLIRVEYQQLIDSIVKNQN